MAIFKSPPAFQRDSYQLCRKFAPGTILTRAGELQRVKKTKETHNNFGHLVKWNGTLNIQFVPQQYLDNNLLNVQQNIVSKDFFIEYYKTQKGDHSTFKKNTVNGKERV